jgi:hypothetical protein
LPSPTLPSHPLQPVPISKESRANLEHGDRKPGQILAALYPSLLLRPEDPLTIPLVCDPHANITYRSSDGILFKLHAKHLEATSARLLSLASRTKSELDNQVPLDETSKVLEILFQFVHLPGERSNHQQPSIMNMKPDLFFAIAGAAEKYVVFSAMSIVILHMQYVFDLAL